MVWNYLADRAQKNGKISESAIDHIYVSSKIRRKLASKKVQFGTSDNIPIMASLNIKKENVNFSKRITKRSINNFTTTNWNEALFKED